MIPVPIETERLLIRPFADGDVETMTEIFTDPVVMKYISLRGYTIPDLLEMYHRVFDRVEALVGEHVWNFADFATGPGVLRVDGNKKGAFTRDRRPTSAAFALRRRWTKES